MQKAAKEEEDSQPADRRPLSISRPDLDRVEKAMAKAGAVQPDLFSGDAAESQPPEKPSVPMPPPIRRPEPVSAVLVANSATASPFAGAAEPAAPRACEGCGEAETLVPPTNLFYACETCYPETFGGAK